MPDSLIFDLDGTLWDITPTVAKARNNALRALGISHTEITAKDVAKTVGLSVNEAYRQSFSSFSEKKLEDLINEVNKEITYILPFEGATLYPGVRNGLSKLHNKFKLYIVSNCNEGYIENFLQWSELGEFFNDFECYGRTKKSKAKNILSVVKRNNLYSPVYIGDTGQDQIAATEANIKYIHVNYGFGKPEFTCQNFNSFEELVTSLTEEH